MSTTMNEIKLNPNAIYHKPIPKVTSIIVVLMIVGLILLFLFKFIYIKSNWESQKCLTGNFIFAPLFGKNSKDSLNKCINEGSMDVLGDEFSELNNRLEENDNIINNYDERINNIKNNYGSVNNRVSGNLYNVVSSSRKNNENVKNALTNLTNSLIVSSKINDGTIEISKTLDNNSFGNIVKKVNKVSNEINKK